MVHSFSYVKCVKNVLFVPNLKAEIWTTSRKIVLWRISKINYENIFSYIKSVFMYQVTIIIIIVIIIIIIIVIIIIIIGISISITIIITIIIDINA